MRRLFPAGRILRRAGCNPSQAGFARPARPVLSLHRHTNEEISMNHPAIRTTLRALFLAAGLLAVVAPMSAASAGPLSWLGGGERVRGSGKIVKQNRELGHFTALATSVSGDVDIRMGSSESVTVETDDNILPLIETVVENGTLRIRPVKRDLQLDTRNMKIVVTVRTLNRVSVAGSGAVDADRLQAESLTFDVGGSGSINLRNLQSESVAIALGGSGTLKASGNTERLQISIGGSGRVEAGQLAARTATVSIGGSGQATVWAQKSLNLSVAGSGDIGYYGDPQISKSIMGSGTIKRIGGSPQ
jgi:hypothetical protein